MVFVGGGPLDQIPLRRFTPSWTSTRVTCDCLLPFVHSLLSQVKSKKQGCLPFSFALVDNEPNAVLAQPLDPNFSSWVLLPSLVLQA